MRTPPHRRGLYAPELLEARIAPATFIVTSLLDNGAEGTLRKEIADANLLIGADTIVVKIPAADLPGTIVLNTAMGEIPIKDSLTIKGPGIDILSISGSDTIRIFNINDNVAATLSPTAISGLTITDGKSASNGGAVYSHEPLSLKNVVVRSSSASGDGGGVWVNTPGKISITGSHIVHNSSGAGGGGLYLIGDAVISIVKTTIADNTAIFNGGLYAGTTTAKAVTVVDSCIVANNKATGSDTGGLGLDADGGGKVFVKNSLVTGNSAASEGGGMSVSNFANFTITKTTFSNNTATKGGAIGGSEPVSVTISGSRFLGNRATDAAGPGGGALYFDGATLVKVTSSIFSGNTSASNGGAISATSDAALAVTGSGFLGNSAADDGGAFALDSRVTLTMKSSILTGNHADDAGGAILATSGTVLNLTGNKFTENSALNGGGIFMNGVAADRVTATLSGNLFQSNIAEVIGGAVRAMEDSIFTSKTDKFIANIAVTGQGGGVHLFNAGGIFITGSLFQSNVAGSSGGGLGIAGNATLTGLKVLGNIAGAGGKGGGLRIAGGTVVLTKSLVTGNIADDGGGIFFNAGTTTFDPATKVTGNVARTNEHRQRVSSHIP